MSLLKALKETNNRLSPDVPIHIEYLGHLLAVGLTARSLCHIVTALMADREPNLSDRGLTISSPVLDLREHPVQDLSARLLTFALSMFFITALSGNLTYTGWKDWLIAGYLAANVGVLFYDPVFYYLDYRR